METEIRQCFILYVAYMKSNIKNLEDYDVENMSVQQIKAQANLLFMRYLMTSGVYSVSKTSPIIIGFNHLVRMINEWESKKFPQYVAAQSEVDKQRSWFFN